MSTNCDHCGYRDNEVKSGGAISEKGKRITLRVEDREDLSRDILKVCSFVDGARDCLLMNKLLRVRHVASQSQRSISYFRPEPLEAGLLRWRVF
jgi:ZPR1 zinc-finger domain